MGLGEGEVLIKQLPWLLCSLVILSTIHSCGHFMSKFVKDPVCSHRPQCVDRRPGK